MPRGGARKGAGRPKGLGKYGEETLAMRIPLSKVSYVSEIVNKGLHEIPLYTNSVSAGFPSPADDYLEDKVDLNQYLVKHPASTFLVRASGESMINAGIFPNDILVVDRSLKAESGKVVIAVVASALASEPASVSVSAKAPVHAPDAILGKYLFFCSSVAKSSIA